jgi:hypothetical protein
MLLCFFTGYLRVSYTDEYVPFIIFGTESLLIFAKNAQPLSLSLFGFDTIEYFKNNPWVYFADIDDKSLFINNIIIGL